MPEISFVDTTKLLINEIKDVSRNVTSEGGKALRDIEFIFVRHIKEEHLTGGTTATRLAVQSDLLRTSIDGTFANTPEGLLLLIGPKPRVIYAATHEFGDDDRNIPERSFLRATIRERADDALKIVDRRVGKALA